MRLRVPSWATGDFTVTVNGVVQTGAAVPGGYLTLSRSRRRGDRIWISASYRLRIERALDDPTVQSVLYGRPVLLVAQSQEAQFRGFSFYKASRSGEISPPRSHLRAARCTSPRTA